MGYDLNQSLIFLISVFEERTERIAKSNADRYDSIRKVLLQVS